MLSRIVIVSRLEGKRKFVTNRYSACEFCKTVPTLAGMVGGKPVRLPAPLSTELVIRDSCARLQPSL